MKKTYIALTIGPIYKTFAEAKRTRAVWASSYFFSWFIREVLVNAKAKGCNIYLPYSTDIFDSEYGSGLYADRIYFVKDEKTSIDIVNTVIDLVKASITEKQPSITKDYIDNYLNAHLIETEIDLSKLSDDDYPLKIINGILDNKELHQNYVYDINVNPLQDLFQEKERNSFLAKEAFGEHANRHFKSISEIASTSLKRLDSEKYLKALNKIFKNSKNDDTDFIDELINDKLAVLPHHKYYAVIYADGDNIGTLLKKLNKEGKDITLFSKALFDFGILAEKTIYDYGGNGIYLGGEDVLCFAPIACVTKKDTSVTNTIFDLVKRLDEDFKSTVQKFAIDQKLDTDIPTLSYGISIHYFKSPLKEAMAKAHDLLEGIKHNINNKNAIGFYLQKHSGKYMECTLEKNKIGTLNSVYEIVTNYCLDTNDTKKAILSSIIQRFRDPVFTRLYIEATLSKSCLQTFLMKIFIKKLTKLYFSNM
jgi:CRISPR-associated protein Cmr2